MSATRMYDDHYSTLALQLQSQNCTINPSVIHGLATGFSCSGMTIDGGWAQFLGDEAMGNYQDGSKDDTNVALVLDALQAEINEHLASEDLSFQPILPSEEAMFKARLYALIAWAQAFIQGFEWAKAQLKIEVNEETQSYLQEVEAIAAIDVDNNPFDDIKPPEAAFEEEDGDDTDNDRDFYEIVEFLRVCVLSIYMENIERRFKAADSMTANDKPSQSPKLH